MIGRNASASGSRFKRLYRLAAMALLVALAPMAGGCYGAFPLTHKVYEVNGEITDEKLVHTLVMWAFLIIPVYSVATFVDAIVFNLIEFWTGETTDLGDASLNAAGDMEVRNKQGELLGVVTRTEDGGIRMIAPDGRLLGSATPAEWVAGVDR
jgi:hypothetical protein